MSTLVDTEGFQTSEGPIAGYPELSNISPYFHQDIAEHLDTIIGTDKPILGCNVTQLASGAPFLFGYLIVTSQRLIHVQFESETKRNVTSWLSLGNNPLVFLIKEAFGVNERPKRPWIGVSPTVPAVNYPSYPLTSKEKASRRVAIHDLENLVSADLASSWYGEIRLMSLIVRFQQGKGMTVTFYAPHEAEETCKILAARWGK